MGFCLRNRIRLLVFSLSDYRELFPTGGSAQGINMILLPKTVHRLGILILSTRLARQLLEWLPFVHYLDEHRSWSNIDSASLKKGLWIIDGTGDWCPFMPKISEAEAVTVRQVLRYHPQYHSHAAVFHAKLVSSCDILIGVHARRGDYAVHRGGRWYYSEALYLNWIEQARAAWRSNAQQKVHVVVCSNEPGFLRAEVQADLGVSRLGSASSDQLLLSMCDVIIGPPSTFSVWAAFLTDTPLLHIFSHEQKLTRAQLRRSTLFYGWKPELEAPG